MFSTKPADFCVIFHNAGQPQVFSHRGNLDHRNSSGNDVASEFFPVTNKRKNAVAFPADRDGGVVNHVGNDMPVMCGRVSGGPMIEAVVCRRDSQEYSSFPVTSAHFEIILA